ncbi:ATP-binding cassette domain-containing protein [Emticicia sp. W12TSBA100-4]|uniref:ATP-binding cassette domain-containing protein n=1 Tax=Emticicia sp. W12TSBA100-4 TaxID=3160965 RepID=UPI0033056B97
MKAYFEIQNLSTGYLPNENVLENICLTLQQGEICAILGEEGAGKTTLLKTIIHKLPYKGQIWWQGKTLGGTPTHKLNQLGIDYNLIGGNILRNFTVKEHLGLALHHYPKTERVERWEALKTDFPRLNDLQNRQGGQLSGGERMIVTLATLTATQAQLLILDEPTAGLSEAITSDIANTLLKLKAQGTTILLLEHNHDFALQIADAVAILQYKQLQKKANKDEFLTQNNYV